MDNHNHHACLGIPIPRCVQNLPQTPPISFHHAGDIESLDLLRSFGRKIKVPVDEIDQASNLASGPSDIVIILERPKSRRTHDYTKPFSEFVDSCNSLKAIDELIRFATNGARSIHTVTVLDSFSFVPKEKGNELDGQCHKLLAEILRVKIPKVIIRCHQCQYEDLWMKRLELSTKEFNFIREEIQVDKNNTAIAFQSFHPSRAVNYNDENPEYRVLLIYHFIAAFAELNGASQLHGDAEEIRKLCIETKDCSSRTAVKYISAVVYLTKALELRYGGPQGSKRDFPNYSRWQLIDKITKMSTMYTWLRYLAGQSHTFGTLGIASAILFLWKEHFKANPLYKQVTSLLFLRGSEQQGWFQTANHMLPIEEEFPKLHIGNSNPSSGMSVAVWSPEIMNLNTQAIICTSTILSTAEEGEDLKLMDAFNPAKLTEIAGLVERQNILINRHIRESTLAQLYSALEICDLVNQCEILAEIMKFADYHSNGLNEQKIKDLTLLLANLRQLSLMRI